MLAGASGRNSYLEVMKMMAEKYKKKMWGSVFSASSRVQVEISLPINNTSTCRCLCGRDETSGNRERDAVIYISLFPLSTVGCGLKQGHRWS